MAFPILPVALAAISIGGGLISATGGRKAIDPEMLRRLFGAEAISEETIRLFNLFINSPVGAQMTTEARLVGSRIGGQVQAALSSSSGQRSAVDEVRKVLASEAGASAVRDVKANLFSNALQGASETIAQQLAAFTQSKIVEQQTPSTAEKIGGAIAGASGRALAGLQAQAKAPEPAAAVTEQALGGAPVVGAAGFGVPTTGRLQELDTKFSPSTKLFARKRTGTLGGQFERKFGGSTPGRF